MKIAEDAEHVWAGTRLELHRAGLLEPEEDRRLLDHVARCAACRLALEALGAVGAVAGAGGHVPASVLARWPGIAVELPGPERELVHQHLALCEACREDLRIAQGALARSLEPVALRRGLMSIPDSWARAWATAATAAAAGFALLWWFAPMRPAGPDSTPESAIVMRLSPTAVRLHGVMRGAETAAPVVVEPGPREPIAIEFEPLDVPDSTPIALEIVSGTGETKVRSSHVQRELYPARHLLVGDESAPLPDGNYVLRLIAWPGSARADSQSYAFTVLRRH